MNINGKSFQARVHAWCIACFGMAVARDVPTRTFRFLEEALELCQSLGMVKAEAHTLVDYTFGRPVGLALQEVGGTLVTLAALCAAVGVDMDIASEYELMSVNEPERMARIRAKQATKPNHSALPQHVTPNEVQQALIDLCASIDSIPVAWLGDNSLRFNVANKVTASREALKRAGIKLA